MTEQWYDSNGDGQGDIGVTDTNGDGRVDLYRADTNFNGTLDAYMSDTDKNGWFDWTGVDRNENNHLEGALQDVPGAEDGQYDSYFVDNNENGTDDRYEPSAAPAAATGVVRPGSNVEFQAGWSNQQMLDRISDNQKLINSNVFGNGDIDNDGKQNYADDYHSNLG